MKIIDRLKSSSPFMGSFVLLIGGSLFGQALAIVASPVLTRLYTPADFGVAGVFISALNILSVCSMLRFEFSIPACATEEDAASATTLAASVGLTFALLLALMVPVARIVLPGVKPELRVILPYLYWLPVGLAATSLYMAFSNWAVRQQNFRLLSKSKIVQAISGVAIQLGTIFVYPGPMGLIVGQIASQSGGVSKLLLSAWRENRQAFRGITFRTLIETARRFKRYPLLSVPAVGLESLFLNVPIIVMATLYGVSVAGWIALVQRIFFMPGLLLARNLGQVILGEMSKVAASDVSQLEHLFWRRFRQMSITGICACIPVAAAAPFVMPIVFGPQWKSAWVCAELLLPMLLGCFTSAVFGTALDVLQRQDLHLVREIGRFILLVIAMATIFVVRPRWQVSLGIVGVMSAIAYVWYVVISWWAIHGARNVKPNFRVAMEQELANQTEFP